MSRPTTCCLSNMKHSSRESSSRIRLGMGQSVRAFNREFQGPRTLLSLPSFNIPGPDLDRWTFGASNAFDRPRVLLGSNDLKPMRVNRPLHPRVSVNLADSVCDPPQEW